MLILHIYAHIHTHTYIYIYIHIREHTYPLDHAHSGEGEIPQLHHLHTTQTLHTLLRGRYPGCTHCTFFSELCTLRWGGDTPAAHWLDEAMLVRVLYDADFLKWVLMGMWRRGLWRWSPMFLPCWTPQLVPSLWWKELRWVVMTSEHNIKFTHIIYIYCIPHDGTQYDDLWDDWGKWSDAVLWRSPSIIFDWCIPAGDLGHGQYVLLQWPRILPVLCDQHAAVVDVCHAVR